jgi:hypothetical protein
MALEGLHIAWFIDQGRSVVSDDIGPYAESDVAGLRLRLGMPAQQLAERGVRNTVVSIALGDTMPALATKPDIAVFTKPYIYENPDHNENALRFIDAAQTLKKSGTAVLFDLSDNLFADVRREYALRMLPVADGVTTSSFILKELVLEHGDREARVIPEPLEGTRAEPAFTARRAGMPARLLSKLRGKPAGEPLRLLWFGGQPATFRALMRWRPELAQLARRQALELAVVMKPVDEIKAGVAEMVSNGIAARLHAWSAATMAEQLPHCDLVLLPTDSANRRMVTSSPNRLVHSLWAGRFPIAGPIPSYLDFADCAWVGENPVDGIDWALSHPDAVIERMRAGQARLEQSFSIEAVAAAWAAVFGELRDGLRRTC